jgi:hypothetical protein
MISGRAHWGWDELLPEAILNRLVVRRKQPEELLARQLQWHFLRGLLWEPVSLHGQLPLRVA